MNNKLVYLAIPYSDPDPRVRQERFEKANKAAGCLMRNGLKVFSPISHTHPIACACDLPLGWEYWESFDRLFLSISCRFYVLKLDGWKKSKGIKAETKIAEELELKIHYLEDGFWEKYELQGIHF